MDGCDRVESEERRVRGRERRGEERQARRVTGDGCKRCGARQGRTWSVTERGFLKFPFPQGLCIYYYIPLPKFA